MRLPSAVIPLIVLAATLPLAAQNMSTDRPGFMDSPGLLSPGVAQVESGSGFSSSAGDRRLSLGGQVIRLGLTGHFELRWIHDGYTRALGGPDGHSGWAGAALGAKIKLIGETAGRPALSLIPLLSVPIGAGCCAATAYDPTLKLSWSKALPRGFGIGGNVNISSLSDSHGRFLQRAVSLSVSKNVAKSSFFAETYMVDRTARDGSRLPVYDAGVATPIGQNFQLDFSAGHSFRSAQRFFFVSAGISIRQGTFRQFARNRP